MGADFILTKQDPTLDRFVYIGVIVKTGKIKQNHADIDNQILECNVIRKIEGGKKEIFLNDVWIVSNDTISPGAQTKIHHNYKNKNITFIDGESVTTLIDKHYNNYWTDISIEIGNFLRNVSDKSVQLTKKIDFLDTTIICAEETYIEQLFINISNKLISDKGRSRIPKRVPIQKVLSSGNLIFIEGSFGTGKTKLLSKLANEYSSNESFKTTKTIPYLISFKEYASDFSLNIDNVIAHIKESLDIPDTNFLIMIDALDEINLPDTDKISIFKDIYNSLNDKNNFKVIITSRPFDLPHIDVEIEKYFDKYQVLPFTMKQIVSLISIICANDSLDQKLFKELEKSDLFKVLPKTPISAIILGKLLHQDIQEIPSTLTELYAKYIEIVLGRWEIEKGLSSQNEYDVILNVSINLAHYMLENELEVIAVSEVKDMFNEYISLRKLKINIEVLFQKLINTDELFKVFDNERLLSFAHRSFSEYFYALYLDRENSAHITEEIYNVYWNNSYFFYFGIKRDSKDLVEALDNIKFSEEMANVSHFFSIGDFLLAAYLTPFDVIEKSLLKTFSDAAKYFNDVVNKNIDSELSILPTFHLLAVFTHNMMSTYSYDFFMSSLEKRSLELSTKTSPSEDEYSELFLINSTLLSNNKFNSFDLMVSNYGKNIPLLFQVGINQTIDEKKASPVIKHFIKKHRKKVSNNISLRSTVSNLFDNPINPEKAIEFIEKIEKLK